MSARKVTRAVMDQVLGSLRTGADVRMAARAAGVSHTALYNKMQASPQFKSKCDEARNYADERVVKSLYDQALAGNTAAMIFWLKNRKRHEWRDKYDHEVVERKEQPAQIEISLADGSDAFPVTTTTTVPGPSTRQ